LPLLIQFRVENHRSLRDEQILSLAATRGDTADPRLLQAEGLDEPLVSVAAIYGANASGKTNVLGALGFMRQAVLQSQRMWEVEGTPREPFLLSDKAREPSLYEAEILVGGVRYRYGFQLSSTRVEEEWLHAWPKGKQALWFEREQDTFNFGKSLHGENEAIRGLTRPNSLFLSAAAQNNHVMLGPIFRYFNNWRFVSRRWRGRAPAQVIARTFTPEGNSEFDRHALMQLLQAADTGILEVRVEQELIGRDLEGGAVQGPSLYFRHRAADSDKAWLPLAAESAGTVTLLDLGPRIIAILQSGGVLLVDELESSLHPALAVAILRLFSDPLKNRNNAQLIFATHDTNLLGALPGERPLRRDQIWFTEKDDTGGTHLYPLSDFHARKEENLERGYLQGRYGAIPFLGDLIAADPKKES
jgi:uncharacterized protein